MSDKTVEVLVTFKEGGVLTKTVFSCSSEDLIYELNKNLPHPVIMVFQNGLIYDSVYHRVLLKDRSLCPNNSIPTPWISGKPHGNWPTPTPPQMTV